MRLVRSVFIALALSVSIFGAVAVADQPPVTGQETVYVTKSGNKYHTASCRFVKSGKTAMKLADAVKGGYTPCGVCKPPVMPKK